MKYLDFGGPDGVYRDNKVSQSTILFLNKERETYLDNDRNFVHSYDKTWELRNKYHFGNDGRMHSDVHVAYIMVDQDGRVMQLQRVCLNKEKTKYLDNERKDVYLNYKKPTTRKGL